MNEELQAQTHDVQVNNIQPTIEANQQINNDLPNNVRNNDLPNNVRNNDLPNNVRNNDINNVRNNNLINILVQHYRSIFDMLVRVRIAQARRFSNGEREDDEFSSSSSESG